MYVSTVRAADTRRRQRSGVRSRMSVPGTVIGLGVVSFFTDLSAEMITAILPLYLVYGLSLGYLQLGLIDGLYTGATTLMRLGGGFLADRLGRPKAIAVAGYSLSALVKVGLPLAGSSLTGIGALIAADRAGKGIRTAPRDAMITQASPKAVLGRAFGVHRTWDTAGALLGPLVAFALISALATGYDVVFTTSFGFAAVGVIVLVFFVQLPRSGRAARRQVSLKTGWSVLTRPALARVCASAAVLGLCTVGDMFLYLAVQQRSGVAGSMLPLLPVGTAVTFMAAAVPVGRLADRLGRWTVFLAGHVLLLVAYLIVGAGGGWFIVVAALGLHGVFYAATDGVLMAFAGPLIPAALRATGLSVIQAIQVLARALGAVTFGATAALWGLEPVFTGFSLVLGVVVAVTAAMSRRFAGGAPT